VCFDDSAELDVKLLDYRVQGKPQDWKASKLTSNATIGADGSVKKVGKKLQSWFSAESGKLRNRFARSFLTLLFLERPAKAPDKTGSWKQKHEMRTGIIANLASISVVEVTFQAKAVGAKSTGAVRSTRKSASRGGPTSCTCPVRRSKRDTRPP